MRIRFPIISTIGFLLALLLQSCIHEYPFPEGENPQLIETKLKITFNLYWERILHNIEISTRDRTDTRHRFIIEVSKDGETYCRDIAYLNDNEFSLGYLTHDLSLTLGPYDYDLVVWYERVPENFDSNFNLEDLRGVKILSNIPTHETPSQCAFASDKINLTEYINRSETEISKEVELQLAGARFELVATDVQQFISDQKASLNQGDTFNINLSFHNNSSYSFNLYEEKVDYLIENLKLSGDLFFPFAEYDELKIAEGFIFCEKEDEITMALNVFNSSLMLITQTEQFTFPVKRGYITTVRGNFLTRYIEGFLSINNIWEGEYVIEI